MRKGGQNYLGAKVRLILVFGEALKTIDLSAMLLQKDVAGGGKECRTRHFFPYQKDWK